jgi:hypothetical protein
VSLIPTAWAGPIKDDTGREVCLVEAIDGDGRTAYLVVVADAPTREDGTTRLASNIDDPPDHELLGKIPDDWWLERQDAAQDRWRPSRSGRSRCPAHTAGLTPGQDCTSIPGGYRTDTHRKRITASVEDNGVGAPKRCSFNGAARAPTAPRLKRGQGRRRLAARRGTDGSAGTDGLSPGAWSDSAGSSSGTSGVPMRY